jgi:hypothetical protein
MSRKTVKRSKPGCEVSSATVRALALLMGSGLLVSGGPSQAQKEFESPPTFKASKILPANLLSGPNHRVDERVPNDGFMNLYSIESRFGTFEANSNTELRIRVSEVDAIAKLDEVSRSEQFAKGVGKAGRDVLESTTGALTDPVDTLEDTASGVKEIFKSVGRSVRGESSGGVRDMVGYSRTKRQYAIALGVDPYSTNEVLQRHLSRVSRAGFVGDFGAATALGLVSGGAGIALSTAGHLHSLKEMVQDMSPEELREINEEKLQAMGVEQSIIDLYLGNDSFSPTYQTALVAILEEIEGAADRGAFVKVAVLAKDEDQALFRVDQARMYANYHKSVARLRAFVPIRKLVAVAARTADGSVVVTLPADYVALTQHLIGFVIKARGGLEKLADVSKKQLWVAGRMSAMARKWFEESGWTVHANAHKKLLPRH